MKHLRVVAKGAVERRPSVAEQIRVFVEAVVAVALMAVMGVIGAFAIAGITGDSSMSVPVGVAAFVLTGAVLVYRHFRALRRVERLNIE